MLLPPYRKRKPRLPVTLSKLTPWLLHWLSTLRAAVTLRRRKTRLRLVANLYRVGFAPTRISCRFPFGLLYLLSRPPAQDLHGATIPIAIAEWAQGRIPGVRMSGVAPRCAACRHCASKGATAYLQPNQQPTSLKHTLQFAVCFMHWKWYAWCSFLGGQDVELGLGL